MLYASLFSQLLSQGSFHLHPSRQGVQRNAVAERPFKKPQRISKNYLRLFVVIFSDGRSATAFRCTLL
ncbi:hypothetical protein QUF82_04235 [Thiotrichales bacterium HSG14]|nr:hypothetical protein [Thiotrichales bacterium HSG14]